MCDEAVRRSIFTYYTTNAPGGRDSFILMLFSCFSIICYVCFLLI